MTDRAAIRRLSLDLADLASQMEPRSPIAARFRQSATELREGPKEVA